MLQYNRFKLVSKGAIYMKYRKLGTTGIKISEISLGSWLTYGGYVEDEKAIKSVHKAYELGINFFDTSNIYRRGEAEKVMGKALKDFPRESYVLATKVFWPMSDGINDRGLSRKHIMAQANASYIMHTAMILKHHWKKLYVPLTI